MSASVKERLKTISKENNKEFNKVLRQYIQERFLYRLSKSIYASNFILKGALLFLAYDISRSRPTRDIDFLGRSVSSNLEDIKNIIGEIIEIQYNDGLDFTDNKISVEEIISNGIFGGIRVKLDARLGTIMERIQIDIGFGDTLTNEPVEIEFPTLLEFDVPKIKVYSLETAIAEKFEVIVSLQLVTSRMKDFYDIYFLAENNNFDKKSLKKSINLTFKTRATDLNDRRYIYAEKFKNSKTRNEFWGTFIRRNELDASKTFSEIVDFLNHFLEPVLTGDSNVERWDHSEQKWS